MHSQQTQNSILPNTNVSNLACVLLFVVTFSLYGFYWLEKQSFKVEKKTGQRIIRRNLVMIGYLIFGSFAFVELLPYMRIINEDLLSKLSMVFGWSYVFLFFFTCFKYIIGLRTIVGIRNGKEYVFLIFLFHILFINWWQNNRSGK